MQIKVGRCRFPSQCLRISRQLAIDANRPNHKPERDRYDADHKHHPRSHVQPLSVGDIEHAAGLVVYSQNGSMRHTYEEEVHLRLRGALHPP